MRKKSAQCYCMAMVGEQVVAEAQIRFMLVDEENV
jgi:3-hydroxymyristoyl/3-hydroxydecanoyl-(acyl carrier protein) dehydratase